MAENKSLHVTQEDNADLQTVGGEGDLVVMADNEFADVVQEGNAHLHTVGAEDDFVVEEIGIDSDDQATGKDMEPKKGLIFGSENDAIAFCQRYARNRGFAITRSSRTADEKLQYFTLACSRQGKAQYSSKNKLKPNPSTKTQCPAKLNFILRGPGIFALALSPAPLSKPTAQVPIPINNNLPHPHAGFLSSSYLAFLCWTLAELELKQVQHRPAKMETTVDVVIGAILFFGFSVGALVRVYKRKKEFFSGVESRTAATQHYAVVPDHRIRHLTIEKFIWEIRQEKPFRFTPRQIASFTVYYSTRLGAGGFGTVFKGALPNGLAVAVKVFHSSLDRRSEEEQFMAEVGTIRRTHHVNLVRLFGFCFDDAVRALVYEYMEFGALDAYLLGRGRDVALPALRDIAVGVARGIRYLHEECQQKIVHYDIKPGNVLLDGTLTPKVADFGLARLMNRADTHLTVSGVRGTPGFAAPEMWMQSGVTEKCDVYSFGMLLFEIIGRRRNFDDAAPESQQWFPKLAWTKYESGELMELAVAPSRGDTDGAAVVGDEQELRSKETVERMCKVAFWCVQQQPEARPPMGVVVKMLEGEMEILPPVNPFQHLMAAPVAVNLWATMTSGASRVSANRISRNSNEIVSL